MITLALIAAVGLIGLGVEISIAAILGRAIHHSHPIAEHPIRATGPTVVVIAFPRIDRRV